MFYRSLLLFCLVLAGPSRAAARDAVLLGTVRDSESNLPMDQVTVRVVGADRNSARLLPYHRMDVSVTRAFRPFGLDAEWFVKASNLYNRRNEWFVQYDTEDATAEVINQLPIIPSPGVNFRW